MTKYQYKAFCNVANNDNDRSTYTKEDIKKTIDLYKKGGFVKDLSQDLPVGYKVEKPKRDNATFVQAYVTNGKPNQSANLRFEILNDKTNSANKDSNHITNPVSDESKVEVVKLEKLSNNDKLEPYTTGEHEVLVCYTLQKGNVTQYYEKVRNL